MSEVCGKCGQVVEWVREGAYWSGGTDVWAHSRCVGSFEMHAVVEVVR